jgi:transcriptional regulator with XRE-family HTH domain
LCQTLWRREVVVETVRAVARRTEPQLGLGAALREFRVKQGLSQEDLAHRASLHPTWVSHLESGRENPSWATVRRLATALNITLAELAARAEALEVPQPDRT